MTTPYRIRVFDRNTDDIALSIIVHAVSAELALDAYTRATGGEHFGEGHIAEVIADAERQRFLYAEPRGERWATVAQSS